MKQIIEHLQNLGIPQQLLYSHEPYSYRDAEFKVIHADYTEVTGLKIKNGPTASEGISLYTIDIDCKKGLQQEGKELYHLLLKEFPELKETYSELTRNSGYHFLVLSDYSTDRGKQTFLWPYSEVIEKPPVLKKGAKLEIEFLTKEAVTIAPTVSKGGGEVGVYKRLNDNPIKFIEAHRVKKILEALKEASEEFTVGSEGRSQNEYRGEKATGEEEKRAIALLKANGLEAVKRGNYIHVYHDGKKRELHITNGKHYIWRWSNQSRTPLKEYVESLGREFVDIYASKEDTLDIYNDRGGVVKQKLVEDFMENRVADILQDCFRLNDSLYKFNGKYWELVEPTAYQDIVFNLYGDMGVIITRDQAGELVWMLNRKISQVAEYDFLEDDNYRKVTAIPFQNGTLYFTDKGEEFKEGVWDPGDRCFIMLGLDYTPEINHHTGIVSEWFTTKFAPHEIEAIKCFMGDLLITQSRTESLLYFIGKGGRGKSTLREAIQYLLPKGSYTSLEISEWKGFRLKDLIKSPLNFMSEINERELKNSDVIKKIISREHVSYEYKGVDSQMGRPLAKHIAIANDLPKMALDGALDRRFHFIRLRDTYLSYDGDFWADFTKDKLTLARFFVEGIRVLRAAKFDLKKYLGESLGSRMKIEMLESHNPLADFVEECLEFDEAVATKATELYRFYEAWHSDTGGRGRMKMTQSSFGKHLADFVEVARINAEKTKKNGIMVWKGIQTVKEYTIHK